MSESSSWHLLVHEVLALLNLLLKVGQHLIEPSLLVRRQFSESHNFFDAVRAELARGCEELGVSQGAFNESALDDFFALQSFDDVLGEQISGVRHRQRRTAGPGLRRDDLVATELGSDGHRLPIGIRRVETGNLAKNGEDGNPGVSANHGNVNRGRIDAHVVGHEGVGTDHVQGRDAANLLGIEHALLFQDLGGDGDGAVYRVRNDGQHGIGTEFGAPFDQRLHDTGVGLYRD